MISPNMILRPLYHIENENQSQNPAHSIVSNSLFFGAVHPKRKFKELETGHFAHFSGRKCWTFEMSKLYHLVFCQNEPKTKYFPLKMKIFIHGLFRN